jgi:hypothetical protein
MLRFRRLLTLVLSFAALFTLQFGGTTTADALLAQTAKCGDVSNHQVVLVEYDTQLVALPSQDNERSSLVNAALAHNDVRLLTHHVRSLGFEPTGVVDTFLHTDVDPAVSIAVMNHHGPNGATAGIVYVTSDAQDTHALAKYQIPEPDPAYRVVTELMVVDGVVSSGSGVMTNSGSTPPCPPGECRVRQTCGGEFDYACVAFCSYGCGALPPSKQFACRSACWPACYIPTYSCDYCAPC